jgi:hypothetical protein
MRKETALRSGRNGRELGFFRIWQPGAIRKRSAYELRSCSRFDVSVQS